MKQIFYFLTEAIRALIEAKTVTFVSIVSIAISLFFMSLSLLLEKNIQLAVDKYSHQASMIAYLDMNIPDNQQEAIYNNLKNLHSIEKVTFISRDSAYKKFESIYGEKMLNAIDENPFPASFEISLYNNDDQQSISSFISKMKGVESVTTTNNWLKNYKRFEKYLNITVLFISLTVLISLYFTITNSIKLTVYARKDLIKNMQYFGASSWYINAPFVLEGVIQGFLGAVIALGAIKSVSVVLSPINLYWGSIRLVVALVLVGIILGFWGSLSALRKVTK